MKIAFRPFVPLRFAAAYLFAGLLFLLSSPAVHSQSRQPDALAEYRAGNYLRAVQICQDEIAGNAANVESHVVICWSLLRLERYEDAMRYAQAGRALNRNDVRITEILGEVSYYQGRNNEALQYFQEYVNQAPEGQRIEMVYYLIGETYIRLGKFRHADIALSTAVHWMPGNAAWWIRLAYARENAGDLLSALNAYEQALSLDSRLNDARLGINRTRQALAGS